MKTAKCYPADEVSRPGSMFRVKGALEFFNSSDHIAPHRGMLVESVDEPVRLLSVAIPLPKSHHAGSV